MKRRDKAKGLSGRQFLLAHEVIEASQLLLKLSIFFLHLLPLVPLSQYHRLCSLQFEFRLRFTLPPLFFLGFILLRKSLKLRPSKQKKSINNQVSRRYKVPPTISSIVSRAYLNLPKITAIIV